jgi:hypothetical protein
MMARRVPASEIKAGDIIALWEEDITIDRVEHLRFGQVRIFYTVVHDFVRSDQMVTVVGRAS